jgi:putative resolvase
VVINLACTPFGVRETRYRCRMKRQAENRAIANWSDLKYDKRGLALLLKRIWIGEVNRLMVTHKNPLLRSCVALVFSRCEHFGSEVALINARGDANVEEDRASDMLEIIAVF